MLGARNGNCGGKALSNILSIWDDNDVNLDDNGGWNCDFFKSCFKGKNTTNHLLTLPRLLGCT